MLLPYILVPLMASLLKRWRSFRFTYLFTLCLLIFYPLSIQIVDDIQHPQQQPGRCLMGEMFFMVMHYLVFLPGALILQFIFNFSFTRKKLTREEAEAINK